MEKAGSTDGRSSGKPTESREAESAPTPEAAFARTLLMQRRLRDSAFGEELFGEPAWDMLLALFLAHEEGRHVSVSSLCYETPVPPTTAHRWMLVLLSKGLVLRMGDPRDRRRSYVYLSADALTRIEALMREMLSRTR